MTGTIKTVDFDLAATLESGQAFRWNRAEDGWWVGVVGSRPVRLRQQGTRVEWEIGGAEMCRKNVARATKFRHDPAGEWVRRYLGLDRSWGDVVATFPRDPLLLAAAERHRGLRVLRQEPWECLASFMASSSKQIVQIRQIVGHLAERFGDPIEAPWGAFHAFPTVDAVARASQARLWECKLGFRARHLLAAARLIDRGAVALDRLPAMEYERALEELMKLPGVGEKIANCTLLFSCGFEEAFPIDVWIERALRRLYFPGPDRVTARQLRQFVRSHFGPYGGWAQQYLFCQERGRKQTRPEQ